MTFIVAATGHRPDKLGGYTDDSFRVLVEFATDWFYLLKNSISLEIRVLSGMALGWDQAIAEAALSLGLHVTACVPCDGQESRWPVLSQHRYRELLSRCTEVVVVSPGPFEFWKMQRRNVYMVDRADLVLALWNGTPGGTKNCVEYAGERGKRVENLWQPYKERVSEEFTRLLRTATLSSPKPRRL